MATEISRRERALCLCGVLWCRGMYETGCSHGVGRTHTSFSSMLYCEVIVRSALIGVCGDEEGASSSSVDEFVRGMCVLGQRE